MDRFRLLAAALAFAAPAGALAAGPVLMHRDPGCPCCEKWAQQVKAQFGRAVRVVDDAHGAAELRLHLLRPFLAARAARIAVHQDGARGESPGRGGERQRGGEKAEAIHV